MYYVRKIGKKSSISKIQVSEIEDVEADVLKDEFRTTFNTLSFWKCSDINDHKNTLLAIILSSSKIVNMDFIFVEDNIIQKYDIKTDDKKPGKTGYKGFENNHIDFCELNYKKIADMIALYKEIILKNGYIISVKKEEIKKMILEANDNGQIDYTQLTNDMKEDIEELLSKQVTA